MKQCVYLFALFATAILLGDQLLIEIMIELL